jgi:hypothetical protein
MKKLLFIPALFIVTTLFAQETLVVPDLECAHKHQQMLFQFNGSILASISYAKSTGKTLEDVAAYTGELFAKSWNKEMGFDGLVKVSLHNAVVFTPGGKVEILEQSGNMIKIRTSAWCIPSLKKDGMALGISYDEYYRFMKIINTKVSENMGAELSMEDTEDGWIMTLKKK